MKFTSTFIKDPFYKGKWLYLLPLLPVVYMASVRLLLIFSRNIDLDGAEFTFVHYIQQLLSGKELYLNPEAYPFSAVIYTPLYLYTVFAACKILHLDYIRDIYQIYVVGRIISFIFVLVSLIYIDKFTRKRTDHTFLRLFFSCVFLLLITGHSYASRPDSMKIAFFIICLYYYVEHFYYSGSKKSLALALVFSILAISAKQDIIIYLLLFQGVNFLCIRKWYPFMTLLASILCYALYFFVLKNLFGDYCLASLFQFNLQSISHYTDSYNFYLAIFNTLRLLPLYLILVYNILRSKDKNEAVLIRMISISGLLSIITTTVFMFRPGSYLNYSYELIVFLILGLLFMLTSGSHSRLFKWSLSGYLLLLFISNILIKNYAFSPARENAYNESWKHYDLLRKELLPLLDHNECIFSPDLELSIFIADKNVIYGHEYHIDRLIYAHLGLKTTSRLLLNPSSDYDRYFENGSVKYLVALDRKETGKLMAVYYPHYLLNRKFDRFLLYEYSDKYQ